MKPDWDRMMDDYKGHDDLLVADVDCTEDGQELCETHEIEGYPTLRFGDPKELTEWNGMHDLQNLQTIAKTLEGGELPHQDEEEELGEDSEEQKAEDERADLLEMMASMEEAQQEAEEDVHSLPQDELDKYYNSPWARYERGEDVEEDLDMVHNIVGTTGFSTEDISSLAKGMSGLAGIPMGKSAREEKKKKLKAEGKLDEDGDEIDDEEEDDDDAEVVHVDKQSDAEDDGEQEEDGDAEAVHADKQFDAEDDGEQEDGDAEAGHADKEDDGEQEDGGEEEDGEQEDDGEEEDARRDEL